MNHWFRRSDSAHRRRGRLGGVPLLLPLIIGSVTGCGTGNRPVALLASSLTDVVPAVATHAGLKFDFVVAGSPTLVTQLENGIDATLIITANPTQMDRALATGRLSQPMRVASNELVLAVAPGNPGQIHSLADLSNPDGLIGRCAPEVPCGVLADRLLAAADLDLTATTEESGARSLAIKINLGELDAGLIYRTDANAFGLATIDDDRLLRLGPFRTDYLAAVIDDQTAGHELLAAITGTTGQTLLTDAGFAP